MENVNLSMRGNVKGPQNMNKKVRNVGGSIAGIAAGSAVQTGVSLGAGLGAMTAMQKMSQVSGDTIKTLHDAAEKALDISGMKAKGVKIEYIPQASKKVNGIKALLDPMTQIKQGKNACFAPEGRQILTGQKTIINKIFMPEKSISFASFHEIGHSINYNNSAFWRTMQKMRMPGMILAAVPLLYGAFSKKSVAAEGQELTKKQKANNFIRDNAGKLSFAAMLPMLAEEAMASIRGVGLAKKTLNSELTKHVIKGNGVAYMSYLGGAIAAGLAAAAAVKIKDHFVEKKAAKLAAQQQTAQKDNETQDIAA